VQEVLAQDRQILSEVGNMTRETEKHQLNKEFKHLFRNMDFVCANYLNKEGVPEKEQERFADIYQQLGQVWEFLALQCKHWDGYRKTREKKEVCRICGTVKESEECHILLQAKGPKKIGKVVNPNSRKTFPNKKEAGIIKDSIRFHGALIDVDVHNAYKSNLFKGHEINISGERNVTLKERGVECTIGKHRIDLDVEKPKKKGSKPPYGNFAFELRKRDLRHFPVIFKFDDDFKFLGLTIMR
jgi:hypothetical protein